MPTPSPDAQARTVNIYVSRDIAFDLDKLNKVTAKVLGRLGCTGCHSGRYLLYHTLEDFIVNPKTLEPEEFGPGIRG